MVIINYSRNGGFPRCDVLTFRLTNVDVDYNTWRKGEFQSLIARF